MKDVISMTDRVKQLRNKKGLSYQALEELTGISRSTLQRYEINNFKRCSLDKIECIANALDVTPGYIMGWESKNASYDSIKIITSLITAQDGKCNYDNVKDAYCVNLGSRQYFITPEEIKKLNDNVKSYFNFCLNEIVTGIDTIID